MTVALSGVRLEGGKPGEALHESRGHGAGAVTPAGTRRMSPYSGLKVCGTREERSIHLLSSDMAGDETESLCSAGPWEDMLSLDPCPAGSLCPEVRLGVRGRRKEGFGALGCVGMEAASSGGVGHRGQSLSQPAWGMDSTHTTMSSPRQASLHSGATFPSEGRKP